MRTDPGPYSRSSATGATSIKLGCSAVSLAGTKQRGQHDHADHSALPAAASARSRPVRRTNCCIRGRRAFLARPLPGSAQRAENVGQDPAVAVVRRLTGSVDAHLRGELPAVRADGDLARDVRRVGKAGDLEGLLAGQPERLPRLTVAVLQRQDAHADQVGAMDAFVGLRDDRADAEQRRPLRGPVTAGPRAVLLAGEYDDRHVVLA